MSGAITLTGEARALLGNRGFRRGASLDPDAKARRAHSFQTAKAASILVDNYLTLSSAERCRFHGHGQAQAPLLRESRKLLGNKVQDILRKVQELISLRFAQTKKMFSLN